MCVCVVIGSKPLGGRLPNPICLLQFRSSIATRGGNLSRALRVKINAVFGAHKAGSQFSETTISGAKVSGRALHVMPLPLMGQP